jgi:hypothetical protein
MAIMWNAAVVPTGEESNSPEGIAWRFRLAQMLVASGYDPTVVKEALFPRQPNDQEIPPTASEPAKTA